MNICRNHGLRTVRNYIFNPIDKPIDVNLLYPSTQSDFIDKTGCETYFDALFSAFYYLRSAQLPDAMENAFYVTSQNYMNDSQVTVEHPFEHRVRPEAAAKMLTSMKEDALENVRVAEMISDSFAASISSFEDLMSIWKNIRSSIWFTMFSEILENKITNPLFVWRGFVKLFVETDSILTKDGDLMLPYQKVITSKATLQEVVSWIVWMATTIVNNTEQASTTDKKERYISVKVVKERLSAIMGK